MNLLHQLRELQKAFIASPVGWTWRYLEVLDTLRMLICYGVKPGNLTFVLENPGKFGPILDIDLLTLISTSNLVSGFDKALVCNDDVIRSMLMQRSRIRQRTRAFVGDAKDNQNFQLLNVRKNKDVEKE